MTLYSDLQLSLWGGGGAGAAPLGVARPVKNDEK